MRVENPIIGNRYNVVYKTGNAVFKNMKLLGVNDTQYRVESKIDGRDLWYDKTNYYLEEVEPASMTNTPPDKSLEDTFLELSASIKKIVPRIKEYLESETKKLIEDMSAAANKAQGSMPLAWNFRGPINSWSVLSCWRNGDYQFNLRTGEDNLVNAPAEIIDRWKELCRLKITLDRVA